MSSSVNKVILIGHLGGEMQMHYFDGGGVIGRNTLATNETWNDANGQKQSRTDWHNLVFRNKTAEIMEKYTTKGDQIFVEGKIITRSYEVEGQKRYVTEINVYNMTFLKTKGSGTTDQNAQHSTNHPEPPQPGEPDDLPF